MENENVYQKSGFKDRRAYLENLAHEKGIPEDVVFAAADMLGPNEDFDGLVLSLEDFLLTPNCKEGNNEP